jgi:chemotaxis protein MotA
MLGFLILVIVFVFCLAERNSTGPIGFFDFHAAIVVFGGVLGALMIALNGQSLKFMVSFFFQQILGFKSFELEQAGLSSEWAEIQQACRQGRRSALLNYIEKSKYAEVRTSCEVLLGQLDGAVLSEKYMVLRQKYLQQYEPVIEGWDLVARLAPSFGMVGTVTGMVQLFKNMSSSSGNLGGAMGMALLATLYGIAFGTAVGGPMSTKMNNELNERLNMIDFIETSTSALLQEFRQGDKK